ncbi:FecR family protein [Tellurirhabdus bombi]|uniref:FecR family protein n=1 Tax=Tellurirhabdus bombi TaxID=2907205 RepID=UPI001F376FFD|nr:FecR family protein [Tellurirhabdus bombi]
MKSYRDYTPEELALDQSFQAWVKSDSESERHFWETWIRKNPDRLVLTQEARRLLLLLDEKPFMDLPDEAILQDIREIQARVQQHEEEEPVFTRSNRWAWWRAAAVWLLLGSIAWMSWQWRNRQNTVVAAKEEKVPVYTAQVFDNQTTSSKKIQLPDSSFVTLKPGSRLVYDVSAADERVANLTGEAFFQVRRQPTRPFLVYAKGVVTKVLGTSFTINTRTSAVRVAVKTGKVSVFAEKDYKENSQKDSPVVKGVILTPNQQVDFSPVDGVFQKTVVKKPELIAKAVKTENFEFRMTPAVEILQRLERAYGIEIVYDKELLKDCALTASLGDETMHEQIKLVCEGINASYQEVDARIIISAKGCQ